MKTKNVILTALLVVFVSGLALAYEPGNPRLVVISQKQGVFKVIYEGSKAGKATMKIYDKENTEVFSQVTNLAAGFIRPVNFTGMNAGDYTIVIEDATGRHAQVVSYNPSSLKSVHIAKTSQEGKYLLAVASTGNEQINVRIFDGSNNLVHDQNINIDGNFGMVYNLKAVDGTPTFEISDKTGNIIKR